MEIIFAILWWGWICIGLCSIGMSLAKIFVKGNQELDHNHKLFWRLFLLGGIVVGGLFWVAISMLENL